MSEEIKNDDTNTDDTNTDDTNINDKDDGTVDGVPKAVSEAIDTVNDQNKDDTDYTEIDDDKTDDDTYLSHIVKIINKTVCKFLYKRYSIGVFKKTR